MVVDIVTLPLPSCEKVTAPGALYEAQAVSLCVSPDAVAFAQMVSVEFTGMGPEYAMDGVQLPDVTEHHWIAAPEVVSEIVTLSGGVPEAGLKSGIAVWFCVSV